MKITRAIVLFALLLGTASVAAAQARPPQRPPGPTPQAGSWEIGGGVVIVSGVDFGGRDADLTRSSGNNGGGAFPLFSTDSRLGAAPGVQGRLGYYLSPRVSVEGGVSFARPALRVRLTEDAEAAPNETAEETLNRYVFDGSVLWHFIGRAPVQRRLVPFVFGGAGYLRDLHDGQELVETGTEYHAGGGVKMWFGNARRRFGVRGEAGVSVRDGGFEFEDKVRASPSASASLVYLF